MALTCDQTYVPYVPEKITIGLSALITSKYRIDQSIISGFETITYYLPFAENRIRFSQVVTQKYEFSLSMSQGHSFPVLTKCRITMHKNQFMLLLNDMKR